jgi:nitrate reductase gamma subunit
VTLRINRIFLCAIGIALNLGGISAYAQAADAQSGASTESTPSAASSAAAPSSKTPQWTRVHRVDDFITADERSKGLQVADKDVPVVVFSHSTHTNAGVSCETCHHTGVEGWQAPACATCHKGAQAVDIMHSACITCHQNTGKGPVSCNDCHTARQTSFVGIVRFQLYDVVRGPLFILAWVIFALGFAWRIYRFTRLTRSIKNPAIAPPVPRPAVADLLFMEKGRSALGRIWARLRRWVRGTVFGTNPIMGSVSLIFHIVLFLLPLLLPAHNILFRQTFHVALPTLPEPFMDTVTLVLLAIGAFFLLRRILFPRVRALTTLRDYLVLVLVAAPFISAYMAYHQWLDYRTVLVVHMLLGEICIAAIPLTKLGHMPFLIFARFFNAGEYAWKPGNRRW